MPIPQNKVALNVAITREAKKLLAKMAIDSEMTMAEFVEQLIRMKYSLQKTEQ